MRFLDAALMACLATAAAPTAFSLRIEDVAVRTQHSTIASV